MFEDFLLKDCKILLNCFSGNKNTNIVLFAQVLEIDDKLMKVRLLGDSKTVSNVFLSGEEIYINICHIVAILIIYNKT